MPSLVLETIQHTSPCLVLLTSAAYLVGRVVQHQARKKAIAQPVVIAIFLVGIVLYLTHVDSSEYQARTQFVSFWLGPATVALAVPIHRQLDNIRAYLLPILVAIPTGAFLSITVAVVAVRAFGGDEQLARTMAPKAVTTPVSVALAQIFGGIPSLTAVFTIVVGILGAVCGHTLFRILRIRDPRIRGLAMGASSHGIGTSRSLGQSGTEGAFASLSMGLSALATSLLMPVGFWITGM